MVAFYKHDISKWRGGTGILSDRAYRVYHVIVEEIYLEEGPIPLHERRLAGAANRSVRDFRAALQELVEAGKLRIEDGRIQNERAGSELGAIFKNRENAAKGGRNSVENPANTGREPVEHLPNTMRVDGECTSNSHRKEAGRADLINENKTGDKAPLASANKPKREEKSREEKKREDSAAADENDFDEAERRCVEATGWTRTDGFSAIAGLIKQGISLEERILPLLREIARDRRSRGLEPPGSWAWAAKAIGDPSRRVPVFKPEIETVFIKQNSTGWQALIASGRRETFLRTIARDDPDFGFGVTWPKSEIEKLIHSTRAAQTCAAVAN
jgi:uncharacterized protein YdaU (DUF1376 family)